MYIFDATAALPSTLQDMCSTKTISTQVDLCFSVSPIGNTYLSRQLAGYPFHAGRLVKKSAIPEHMAMLFLQCTSGGLFEHDRINLCLHVNARASAQVKNAAATVVHSMTGGHAHSHLKITLENNAYLEYVANLNILFPEANLINQIEISLDTDAVAIVSDAYSMHDPQHLDQCFKQLDTSITVYNAQKKLLVRDRLLLTGQELQKQLTGLSTSFDTHGGIFILRPNCTPKLIETLLQLIAKAITSTQLDASQAYIGSGSLPNQSGVFVRILAVSAEPVRKLLDEISNLVRNHFVRESGMVNKTEG